MWRSVGGPARGDIGNRLVSVSVGRRGNTRKGIFCGGSAASSLARALAQQTISLSRGGEGGPSADGSGEGSLVRSMIARAKNRFTLPLKPVDRQCGEVSGDQRGGQNGIRETGSWWSGNWVRHHSRFARRNSHIQREPDPHRSAGPVLRSFSISRRTKGVARRVTGWLPAVFRG